MPWRYACAVYSDRQVVSRAFQIGRVFPFGTFYQVGMLFESGQASGGLYSRGRIEFLLREEGFAQQLVPLAVDCLEFSSKAAIDGIDNAPEIRCHRLEGGNHVVFP